MAAFLLAGVALILSLAASAFTWQLWRSTVAARASAPGEMLVRMAELEEAWADLLDSNGRFLKRIAERDRREAKKAAQIAPEPTNGEGIEQLTDRDKIRALARSRGLIR